MQPLDPTTLLISRRDVERWVDMADALSVVEDVLVSQAKGKVAMPAKVTMNLFEFGIEAWNTAMPAYIESQNVTGVKWVGGFAQNQRYGLPSLVALILIQDPRTGRPLAVMDGGHITNLRTGAVTALAVKHYGRGSSPRIGMIGAGVQARFAVEGIKQVTGVRSIGAYDISPAAAAAFANEMRQKHGIEVDVCADAREAVNGAELIITATTAVSPIVKKDWMGSGVTAISIGSQGQEFDDEAILTANKLVCDSWEQCTHLGELRLLAEAGRVTAADVFAEIGQTVAGVRPGRENDNEYILVVPIGLGSLDIGLAKFVYERACESGDRLMSFRFL